MSERLPADADDQSISGDEILYRRIPLNPSEMIQETDVPGEFRPSSGISEQKVPYPLIGVRSRPLSKRGIELSQLCFT